MDRFSLPLALLILAVPLVPATATPNACLDGPTAARYVRELNIDAASFGGIELCNPKAPSQRLFNDLRLIEEGAFTHSGGNLFIQDLVPTNGYYSWLTEQIRGIEHGDDLPWSVAYNSWGLFTLQNGWSKLSTLGRIGALIHEARHTEGYAHTTCDHGPYKDTNVSGCDGSLEAGGSHAVEMEYYARVAVQGAAFHPVYRAMARLTLLARSGFAFNESPTAAKDALLIRTPDGLTLFKDGARAPAPWSVPDTDRLKRTSPALTANLHPPAGLTDGEEVDWGLRRQLVGIDRNQRAVTFQFGTGTWTPVDSLTGISHLADTDPLGHPGLFAVFADRTFCQIRLPGPQCERGPTPWPEDAKRFVRYRKTVLWLGTDGTVYDSKNEPWPDLEGEEILDMTVLPDYEVFE